MDFRLPWQLVFWTQFAIRNWKVNCVLGRSSQFKINHSYLGPAIFRVIYWWYTITILKIWWSNHLYFLRFRPICNWKVNCFLERSSLFKIYHSYLGPQIFRVICWWYTTTTVNIWWSGQLLFMIFGFFRNWKVNCVLECSSQFLIIHEKMLPVEPIIFGLLFLVCFVLLYVGFFWGRGFAEYSI